MLCLPLAACGSAGGGDRAGSRVLTKSEYETKMRAALAEAERTNNAVKTKDDKRKLGVAVESLDKLTTKLSALRPPKEVAQAHLDLTAALKILTEKRVRPVAEAVKRGDRKEAARLVNDVPVPAEVATRARTARETFARLGYDIGMAPLVP